jgi:uncharacterized repeat protein (TIGR03803 family)
MLRLLRIVEGSILRQPPRAARAAFVLGVLLAGGVGTTRTAQAQTTYKVLHDFTDLEDGAYPAAGLNRDSARNLYGTTSVGGNYSFGTVFKLDSAGKETVLYSFTGEADGGSPYAALIQDAAGNLYGTTSTSDAFGPGIVFKLDAAGNETMLYSFTGGDGRGPSLRTVDPGRCRQSVRHH